MTTKYKLKLILLICGVLIKASATQYVYIFGDKLETYNQRQPQLDNLVISSNSSDLNYKSNSYSSTDNLERFNNVSMSKDTSQETLDKTSDSN